MDSASNNSREHTDASDLTTTTRAPLSDEGHNAIVVYLTLVGCAATVGNVTVVTVILCHRTALQKMHNVLLLNLAAVDLLVSLTAYALTAVASAYRRWVFGDLACQVGGFLVFMLSMVSMDTLTFISVFRYILICKPKRRNLLTVKNSCRVVLITWAHSLLWTSLPLLGWSSYVPEPFRTACSLDWASPTLPTFLYILLTLLTCYTVHVIVIVFCYVSMWRTCRSLSFGLPQRWRKDGGQDGGGGGRGGGKGRGGSMKMDELLWRHKVETERGVTMMCAVMVLAYLVCWTPYAVLSMMVVGGMTLPTPVTTIPTMFAKLSCCLNPVIYALMSAKFRSELGELLRVGSWTCCLCCPRGGGWRIRRRKEQGGRVANSCAENTVELSQRQHFHSDDGGGGGGLGGDDGGNPVDVVVVAVTEARKTRRDTVVSEYRADLSTQGVYLGRMSLALETQSSVF